MRLKPSTKSGFPCFTLREYALQSPGSKVSVVFRRGPERIWYSSIAARVSTPCSSMKKRTFMRLALFTGSVVVAVLTMLGCSSSKNNGPTASAPKASPITSQPSEVVVSNLTSSQAEEVCHEIMGYLDSQMGDASCLSTAISSSASAVEPKGACEAAYSQCLKSDAGVSSQVNCAFAWAGTQSCSSTIGEVTHCIADEAAAVSAASTSLSCAQAGVDAGSSAKVTAPATCLSLQTACPFIASLISQ